MPYAGGSADVYRSWQQRFPEAVDICLVHLPGRGRRIGEQAFTSLAPMVSEIANQMRDMTGVPYALYGHSMGAIVSFELSRKLFREHGAGPKHLFVSGGRAPQCAEVEPAIYNLPRDSFIEELKKLNGTPGEILDNPEVMDVFITPLRADFEVVDTYQYVPGERLPCPITVYGGVKDHRVPEESCRAWEEQTSAGCRVRMFNGDHFFIHDGRLEFLNIFRADVLESVLR